jgi:hypothetical protein
VDDFVAEHVVGVGQRRRKRQRDPALSRLGDSGRAVVNQSGHHQRLIEIRLRAVQRDRLSAIQLLAEETREAPIPPLRKTSGDVDGFAMILMEVDIEVFRLQHSERMPPILHLVLSEVLRGDVSGKYEEHEYGDDDDRECGTHHISRSRRRQVRTMPIRL